MKVNLQRMDKKHVAIIQTNFEELVDVTHQVDDIIRILEERKVLNSTMVKFLMVTILLNFFLSVVNRPNYHFLQLSMEHRKKLRHFYEMIQGRGPGAFKSLLQVLRETENFRAENLLTKDKYVNH